MRVSKHGVTQYFRFTVDMYFVLDFFIVWCLCDGKKNGIIYLTAQTSQIDYFHHVHKILRWIGSSDLKKKPKRPMGHIAHLRKQLKSINTYDYIMTLIKRRKNKNIINFMRIYWFFIWTNLNLLHPRMSCAKFGWNWLNGSGEEDFITEALQVIFHKKINHLIKMIQ